MINYTDNTICQGKTTEQIDRWEVWYRTPTGLCPTLQEAIDACNKYEMSLQFSIIPVVVAIGRANLYEEVPR